MPKFDLQKAIALEKEGPFETELEHTETGKTKTFSIPQDLEWTKLQQLEDMGMDTSNPNAIHEINKLVFGEQQYKEMTGEYGLPTHGVAERMLFMDAFEYVVKVHIGEDRAKKAMEQVMEQQKNQTNGTRKGSKKKVKASA